MPNDLLYQFKEPDRTISDFVESFWMLENHTSTDKEIIVLPDGRIDIFLTFSGSESFQIVIMGLGIEPSYPILKGKTVIFAISLKLLSVEYLLGESITTILNKGKYLPPDFWGFSPSDLIDFDSFCIKATVKIKQHLTKSIDDRKQSLFRLIYSTKGTLTIAEYAEKTYWSSRQINRYFNQQFGLALKTYCSILRFRASFNQIKRGKLFPEADFADQAHFIKEVKKLSGVIPKELSRNKNDRFIQFSILT
jgi:AraC-like DNA-binding protein